MSGLKPMLQSKGVWGGLIVLMAWGLGAAGYVISESDQKTLVDIIVEIANSDTGVAAIAMAVANAAGALLAIYGRIKARDQIK